MNSWEEVKERILIEEIIGEYVSVQPAGRNFRCLSPFRQEKTPSLIISPDKKIWHDFGSGDGGDVFEFVARIENISRFEALKKLAQKVGVEIKSNQQITTSADSSDLSTISNSQTSKPTTEASKFDKGLALLEWSADIYHKVLLKILQNRSNPITEYCLKRGLDQQIIQVFRLGYAPSGGFLINLAKKHSINTPLLFEVGLFTKLNSHTDDEPTYKDKFSDRLMIPVKNSTGKVVGFTGRVLQYDKTDRPKYLNSPQTDWFNKSRIWYGFDLNRKNFVRSRTAIIVEGNMDVISAYRFGLNYALASQGTSFTAEQLKILKSYVDILHLAFDNDEAGQIAGRKLFLEATKLGFVARKLIIPDEHKDLDEYLTYLAKSTPVADISSQLQVVNYIDWQLSQKSSLLAGDNFDAQKLAILDILELLSVCDSITMEQYVTKLAKTTGITKSKLVERIEQIQQAPYLNSAHSKSDLQHIPAEYTEQLTSWQLLICFYLYLPNSGLAMERLENMYNLLREFLIALQNSSSFQEYVEQNKEIFALIWENKQQDLNLNYLKRLYRSLMLFLDQKVESFFTDSKKFELYSKLRDFKYNDFNY